MTLTAIVIETRPRDRNSDVAMDPSRERSPLSKVHYRPIEAAIRWTRLWKQEREILEVLQDRSIPNPDDFPQWPALRLNAERIYDGLRNGDLPYGVNGHQAAPDTSLEDPDLTIRHVHLREWMQRYYPDQRPRFLFGALERRIYPAISIDDVRALAFECDSLKSLLAERDAEIGALRVELRALLRNIDKVPRHHSSVEPLSRRSETVYLHIIGGQLELLLGKDAPNGKVQRCRTQEEVIAALTERYGKRLGMTKTTLENKFSLANRLLSDQS